MPSRGAVRGVLLGCVLNLLALGCGATPLPGLPAAAEPPSRARLQALLDRQAQAVRDRDEAAYLATVDPAAEGYRARQRRVFANLRKLPLAEWSYRVTAVRPLPAAERAAPARTGRAVVLEAELRHRLRDWDRGPRLETERFTAVRRDGRWRLAAERPDSDTQLWEQGPLTVVRGARGLVLGVGRPHGELLRLAAEADRAVPAVDALWPGPWSRRIVVYAPADLDRTAALLSASPARYRGIAAVTSSERGTDAPADRIVVNPAAHGPLGAAGRQVVMTHEAAHVATREDTTDATPMWLSEGFADWIGYGGTDRDLRPASPELLRAVRQGEVPRGLPSDADFAFEGPPHVLARAYESGRLACLLIAEEWGAGALVAFYRAAGRAGPGAGDRALREVLGVDQREFDARWRAYVLRRLG